MTSLLDTDMILSESEQWMRLDEEWKPVDLETDEETKPSICNTLDSRKTTFDSPYVFKRKKADLDYTDFIHDLEEEKEEADLPLKQFYFISGQILSALSVEEICDKIDDIFRSVERLCSATSTIRKKPKLPEVIQCSISGTDLSFDDTILEEGTSGDEKEKSDGDDVDRYIDEAFEHLNATIASLDMLSYDDKGTVTNLVKKFSDFLKSPPLKSPRRTRQCGDRFRELAEFWNKQAFA